MGYACPVCGDPQADATHLANHLAFTALVRGGDHEEYLDEEVPEWDAMGEDTLADHVVDLAEETDYPQVFEDTTGDGHDHDHGEDRQPAGRDVPDAMLREAEEQLADAETVDTDEIIEEAIRLTQQRHADDADDSETE